MTFARLAGNMGPMNTPTTQADKLAAVPEAQRHAAQDQAHAFIKGVRQRAADVEPWLQEAEEILWTPL